MIAGRHTGNWPARPVQRPFTARTAACDAILSEGERRHPAGLKPSDKADRVNQSVAFNLLLRLHRYADAALLFVFDPAVTFTDNLGERAIRMPKVKQKIFRSFRTLLGAQNFNVIRSCLDTLRKKGHGMLAVLQRAFAGNAIQPPPPPG